MIVRPVPQSRPKPTASAYMMFCSSKRSEVQAANPAANFAELGKILGQMWASYTPDEKKIYVEQASLFKGQIKPDMITTSGDHSNIGSTHLSGSISSSNTGHGHHVLLDVSLDQLEQSEEEMGVSMDEHQEGLE